MAGIIHFTDPKHPKHPEYGKSEREAAALKKVQEDQLKKLNEKKTVAVEELPASEKEVEPVIKVPGRKTE